MQTRTADGHGLTGAAQVLAAFAAFGRDDLAEARTAFSDDYVHHVPGRGPLAGTRHGLDDFMELLSLARRLSGHTERLSVDVALADDNHVMLYARATGQAGGDVLDIRHAYVFRLADGLVVEGRTIPEDLYAFDAFWTARQRADSPHQPLTQERADAFAREWVDAWNAHDLDAIMSHYHGDVVFVSPFAAKITGRPVVEGADALKAYFASALNRFSDLRFDLFHVLTGDDSVALIYRSVLDLRSVEVMTLNSHGRVVQARAHYAPLGD